MDKKWEGIPNTHYEYRDHVFQWFIDFHLEEILSELSRIGRQDLIILLMEVVNCRL
jgi:hypothetical protein